MRLLRTITPAFATLATCCLWLGLPSSVDAGFPVPVGGTWTTQGPAGNYFFKLGDADGIAPDGSVFGRFIHGGTTPDGTSFKLVGTYFYRQIGPNTANISLQFDNNVGFGTANYWIGTNALGVTVGNTSLKYLRQ